MSEYVIRAAAASEVSWIGEIVDDAYAHYVERIGRMPAPMSDDYNDLVEAGLVWVITVDDTLAGLIVLRSDVDSVLVSNVAVATAYQGRGLGRRLLEFAETYALDQGKRELVLYTNELMHENLAIYAKLGWKEFDRAEMDGFRRVFMRKVLAQ